MKEAKQPTTYTADETNDYQHYRWNKIINNTVKTELTTNAVYETQLPTLQSKQNRLLTLQRTQDRLQSLQMKPNNWLPALHKQSILLPNTTEKTEQQYRWNRTGANTTDETEQTTNTK